MTTMQDVEQAVLSCILTNETLLYEAVSLGLKPHHFPSTEGSIYFNSLLKLSDDGRAVDLVTLRSYLVETGKDPSGLYSVGEFLPDPSHFRKYIGHLRDQALAGQIAHGAKRMHAISKSGEPSDKLMSSVWSTIMSINDFQQDTRPSTIKELVQDTVNSLEDGSARGIETGFHQVDTMTGGSPIGGMIVFAGRPGMGKTALALTILKHMAEAGHPSAFFTYEMSAQELTARLIAMDSELSFRKIWSNELSPSEVKWMMASAKRIERLPVVIDDAVGDLENLIARVRKYKASHKVKVVFVDYLQLLADGGESRVEEVGRISRSLKLIAMELDLAVIALSQLNRSVEHRDDKRPTLSDLRESGAIEQDAHAVGMLYRQDYYSERIGNGRAELIFRKNRSGPTGTCVLDWWPEYMTFNELDQYRQPMVEGLPTLQEETNVDTSGEKVPTGVATDRKDGDQEKLPGTPIPIRNVAEAEAVDAAGEG